MEKRKKKKIFILHAHTENRGDESAVRALIDMVLDKYPDAEITISFNEKTPYPNLPEQVTCINRMPKWESRVAQLEFFIILMTRGRIAFTREGRQFLKRLKEADIVLHAPGGPSIGDIYYGSEWQYLKRLNLIREMGIPYMFYAPSMGPFTTTKRNKVRKKILNGAKCIVVRDPISLKYVNDFLGEEKAVQSLDSAFQNEIDIKLNEQKLEQYGELKLFLKNHEKNIGITITDLKWHPKHGANNRIRKNIKEAFETHIRKLTEDGYGVIFIPQLYGILNDEALMKEYCINENCFVVRSNDEKYDAIFQQYLISKLYAVIGMRYHSNIFSAKMGTPFISISYEQKMLGFMQTVGLDEYCIKVEDLTVETLNNKFEKLINEYDDYRAKLDCKSEEIREKSRLTTYLLFEILENRVEV